MKVIMSG